MYRNEKNPPTDVNVRACGSGESSESLGRPSAIWQLSANRQTVLMCDVKKFTRKKRMEESSALLSRGKISTLSGKTYAFPLNEKF